MATILGSIPFFDCLVRAEYTQGLKRDHDTYIPAVAHAVRCVRGHSLWFQCMLLEPYGGCAFLLPIEALVWKPCEKPGDMTYQEPWDCFSSEFGVCEIEFVRRGAVEILPGRIKGQYLHTIDFAGSDLAEHVEQHKSLHVCKLETGLIGAFPNNRILWSDPAFWKTVETVPRFESLPGEYRAEGNQDIFRTPMAQAPVTEYVGEKKPKSKPAKAPAKKPSKKAPAKKK